MMLQVNIVYVTARSTKLKTVKLFKIIIYRKESLKDKEIKTKYQIEM